MEKIKNIELRSPEYIEILGNPSHKLLIISNILVLGLFIGLFFFIYFFNYPQKIIKRGLVVNNSCVIAISSLQISKIRSSTEIYFKSDLFAEKYSANIDSISTEPKIINQEYYYVIKLNVNSNFKNSIPGNFEFITNNNRFIQNFL